MIEGNKATDGNPAGVRPRRKFGVGTFYSETSINSNVEGAPGQTVYNGGWIYREAFAIIWGGAELTDQFDFLTEGEAVRKKAEALIDRRFPPEAK